MTGRSTILILALVLVAGAAFVLGRSCRSESEVVLPTPETGGEVSLEPTEPGRKGMHRLPGGETGPIQAPRQGRAEPTVPLPRADDPGSESPPAAPTEAPSAERQVYENEELGVAVAKPAGPAWRMTDRKASFHGMPRPHKVLEMRRDLEGGGAFAHVELFVAQIPPGETAASVAEGIERHEDITKWAEEGRFTVLEARQVEIAGRGMTRRMLRVDFRERTVRLLSLWTARRGKLYMLLAMTDPRHFAALEPELDQIVKSLRWD